MRRGWLRGDQEYDAARWRNMWRRWAIAPMPSVYLLGRC